MLRIGSNTRHLSQKHLYLNWQKNCIHGETKTGREKGRYDGYWEDPPCINTQIHVPLQK